MRGIDAQLATLGIARDSNVVLHTTYLAPAATAIHRRGHRAIIDCYDLVWRAHAYDARLDRLWRVPRTLYSGSVRVREHRALAKADALLMAGWGDRAALPSALASAWVPTGMRPPLNDLSGPRQTDGTIRIGMIGNFAHSATSQAASELLASPLARDDRFEIVFAGKESREWSAGTDVVALGAVARTSEFYDSVDATVVPITNGVGMKCKLSESLLAGLPTITTHAGAAGFPPEIRALLVVASSALEIDPSVVLDAIRGFPRESTARAASAVLSEPAAVRLYAAEIGAE